MILKLIRKRLLRLIFVFQKILLFLSYFFFFPLRKLIDMPRIDWVVGVDEIASVLHNASAAIPNSFSVNLGHNHFYQRQFRYRFSIGSSAAWAYFSRLLVGPVLLGWLANRTEHFLYIWSTGFLISELDGRAFEFSFLRKRHKRIACMFLGNDIRAPRLVSEFAKANEIDLPVNYYHVLHPYRLTPEYDQSSRRLARATDRYADIIFNAPVDQMSYLKNDTHPVPYFFPDEQFLQGTNKFAVLNPVRIVHAPSNPVVKGTQLVRAAIAHLKQMGYAVEYTELQGVSNVEVLDRLRTAHVVLNEFYALVPGYFGIEAMASRCALLTSADPTIETSLPVGSSQAWMITKHYQVLDNLKRLLDQPDLIRSYADAGYAWCVENAAISCVGPRFVQVLKKDVFE